MKKYRAKLEPSEQSILNASAQIFSAFVIAGQYHEAQERELAEKSVRLAIALADRVEVLVIADGELPS